MRNLTARVLDKRSNNYVKFGANSGATLDMTKIVNGEGLRFCGTVQSQCVDVKTILMSRIRSPLMNIGSYRLLLAYKCGWVLL